MTISNRSGVEGAWAPPRCASASGAIVAAPMKPRLLTLLVESWLITLLSSPIITLQLQMLNAMEELYGYGRTLCHSASVSPLERGPDQADGLPESSTAKR